MGATVRFVVSGKVQGVFYRGWTAEQARAFELDPYLVRQPTASFRAAVDLPSQVDVYVGNNRIYRQNVGPGPFELGNLSPAPPDSSSPGVSDSTSPPRPGSSPRSSGAASTSR